MVILLGMVDVAENINVLEKGEPENIIGGQSYMATEKSTSVRLTSDQIQEINNVCEKKLGITPNVSAFVRKAVEEKLEFYRNAKLQVAGKSR